MSGRTTLLEYGFHGKQIVPQKRAVKKQQKFFHSLFCRWRFCPAL